MLLTIHYVKYFYKFFKKSATYIFDLNFSGVFKYRFSSKSETELTKGVLVVNLKSKKLLLLLTTKNSFFCTNNKINYC